MDYEGCCGDGAPPPEMVADAKETVSLRAENARLQAHIKVLDERGMQASLYVRLCHERDALQARVEEAERRGVDFWHLVENREAGWRYALECRQDRIRELKGHIARLEATVTAMDTDLTEMTTTMAEHFDSVDLNDLPVSLTKGIKGFLALAERRKEALEADVELLRTLASLHHDNLDATQELRVLKVLNQARAAIEEGKR